MSMSRPPPIDHDFHDFAGAYACGRKMPRLMTILAFACHGAAAAVIVAVAACAARRWRFARDVSGAAAQAGALLLLASVATVFICPVTARDPSMKAVALSQGVSEGLNT